MKVSWNKKNINSIQFKFIYSVALANVTWSISEKSGENHTRKTSEYNFINKQFKLYIFHTSQNNLAIGESIPE